MSKPTFTIKVDHEIVKSNISTYLNDHLQEVIKNKIKELTAHIRIICDQTQKELTPVVKIVDLRIDSITNQLDSIIPILDYEPRPFSETHRILVNLKINNTKSISRVLGVKLKRGGYLTGTKSGYALTERAEHYLEKCRKLNPEKIHIATHEVHRLLLEKEEPNKSIYENSYLEQLKAIWKDCGLIEFTDDNSYNWTEKGLIVLRRHAAKVARDFLNVQATFPFNPLANKTEQNKILTKKTRLAKVCLELIPKEELGILLMNVNPEKAAYFK